MTNPDFTATFSPPVMQARTWITGKIFPAERPLLNLSQAAPVDPPPEPMRQAMAEIVLNDPGAHLYGPVLGLPELRDTVAQQWGKIYGGQIAGSQVAITSGCNQAFCAALATLAQAGDNVILPSPWYFNHRMWLGMSGVETRALPCGDGMLPDVDEAEALIDARTKAIVLVTPNNPTGAEYPAGLLRAFFDLARKHGLALIVDETYRDFHSVEGAPHDLFADPDWSDTLIHLYSFSKAFRLTGHRVGAIIAGPARMVQVEKFLDTVTICPNQLGQRAALYGLQNLSDWVAGERAEILSRRAEIDRLTDDLNGWQRLGSGAYFAYLQHPFDMSSEVLAQRLVDDQSLLLLPGTMFAPTGTDGFAERTMRVAFANADVSGLQEMARRIAAFTG
ncbi:Aspartate/methionine/tyrosine aminotransferase [Monaibacterium marinum]|uniref:aspartate transaminase n=1 Tax=Pontivivens marinum TaxID=1690039 RepID=A0A2C9CQX0_9RHOB|nr:aminotransferase [Monaibacterium marinum]SOH93620.1 Aspartate/methionine/tyrosine aminotransferase [Monaibacterium marinum]